MGRVSVHLEEMASLVRELRTVAESLAGDAETIDSAVRWNGGAKRIGGESFTSTRFDNLSEVGAWADDQVPTLSRQLDYARWLQSSTPGMQGEVSFDADDVPHLDDEEIQDRAREANNLLSTMPPISDRLVLLLQTYGFDERFAGVLDAPVDALEMVQLARKEVDEEDLESFDEDYAVLLESLGLIASLESGRYDPELDAGWLGGPPDFSRYNTRDLKLEAMLMSYGTWDEGYLDAFAENLIERQREDPEIWTETMFGHSGHYDSIYSPILPGGEEYEDPFVGLMAALSNNPAAFERVVMEAGEGADIMVDGERVQIPERLRFLMLERAWPEDGGISLQLALREAMRSGDPWVTDLQESLENVVQMDPPKEVSWYSWAGHVGLDILGLIPVVGNWADGLNASWYVTEGNYLSASLSAAALVPLLGQGTTLSKWVNRITRTGQAGAQGGSAVLTVKDLMALLDPANFEVRNPGTPQERVLFQGQEVSEDAVFVPDQAWNDGEIELDPDQTYLFGGSLMVTTGPDGEVLEVFGDIDALNPDQQATIRSLGG